MPRRRATIGVILGMLAVASGGCGSRRRAKPWSRGLDPLPAADAGTEPSCRLSDLPRPPERNGGGLIAVTAGPQGLRAFSRERWWDAAGSSELSLAPGATVAWTGRNYLVASGRTLAVYDAALEASRARRSLPSGLCDVHLFPTSYGIAMVYRRVAPGACAAGVGPVFFQRLDGNGVPLAAPVRLGRQGGGARAHAARLRARMDVGRIVIATEGEDPSRNHEPLFEYTIMAPDGRELAAGEGRGVACLRAGCVRLMGSADPQRPEGGNDKVGLKVAVLGAHGVLAGFAVPLEVEEVTDVAVHGDTALVVYRPPGYGEDESSAALVMALLDVPRRKVIPVFDPVRRSAVTVLQGPAVNATTRIRVVDGTFVLADGEEGTEGSYRTIACRR